jgi:hypothetical protein
MSHLQSVTTADPRGERLISGQELQLADASYVVEYSSSSHVSHVVRLVAPSTAE